MKQTQKQQILEYLQKGFSLTPLDALRHFGCNRLAARINELRNEGHPIQREMVEVYPMHGGVVTVARYTL